MSREKPLESDRPESCEKLNQMELPSVNSISGSNLGYLSGLFCFCPVTDFLASYFPDIPPLLPSCSLFYTSFLLFGWEYWFCFPLVWEVVLTITPMSFLEVAKLPAKCRDCSNHFSLWRPWRMLIQLSFLHSLQVLKRKRRRDHGRKLLGDSQRLVLERKLLTSLLFYISNLDVIPE